LLTVIPLPNNTVTLRTGAGEVHVTPEEAISRTGDDGEDAITAAQNGALFGGLSTIGAFMLIVLFWIEYGKRKLTDQQLRGATLVDGQTLTRDLEARNDCSPYRLAGVPIRKKAENLHTLIAGAQGVGKSQQFFSLMTQVRARKKRAIVYDPSGEFTAAFFREGKDVLLNPLDKRSPNWNPWREIGNEIHFDNMAEGLIPIPPKVSDPFFAIAGRNVFKDSLRALGRQGRKTNADLYRAIAKSNLEALHAILAGEAAATYVDPVTERTGMSLKMTVQNQLDCFRFLHDEGEPFSIRKWIQNEDEDSWLFITVTEEQKVALLPLISLWVDIAIRAVLGLKPIHRERLWFFLDELPTLQKLEILKLALTNTRKYGACFALGVQDFSQLYEIYGEHLARTIISGCQTKLLLRVTDGEAAKALANAIGQAELDEKEETLSIGIDDQRDGMSVFARRNLRDLVLSSEILRLPDMAGYLVTPGDYSIAKVSYDYVEYPQIVTPFIGREVFSLDGGGRTNAVPPTGPGAATTGSGGNASRPASGNAAGMQLKPGQMLDMTTGEIRTADTPKGAVSGTPANAPASTGASAPSSAPATKKPEPATAASAPVSATAADDDVDDDDSGSDKPRRVRKPPRPKPKRGVDPFAVTGDEKTGLGDALG
jgi:type IV conjugative transfer system coupling protein TraD